MKKLIGLLVLFTAVVVSCSKRDPNLVYYDSAKDYNNFMVNEREEVDAYYSTALDDLIAQDIDAAKSSIDALRKRAEDAVNNIGKMAPYNKDEAFRKSVKDLMGWYVKITNDDLQDWLKLADSDDPSYDDILMVAQGLDDEEGKLEDVMILAQKEFAAKNNLRLE